jgi:site-specific DNA recombinase
MVDLPGRFSNKRLALKTLIRRVLRGSEGRSSRSSVPERRDSRGPVKKHRVQSQTRLRPSKRAELIADYEAGMSVRAISQKYGVHRSTIPAIVRRGGAPVRGAGLDGEQTKRASVLYEGGMTLVQVARSLGIGNEAARQAVLNAGGVIRPRGRHPQR